MALRKTIEISGQKVTFATSAAVPRKYREIFGRDWFNDLQSVTNMVDTKGAKKENDVSNIPIESLEAFENIAYMMAYYADPQNTPDDIYEWLDQFSTFSIYEILPALLEVINKNEKTTSKSRKKSKKQAGK